MKRLVLIVFWTAALATARCALAQEAVNASDDPPTSAKAKLSATDPAEESSPEEAEPLLSDFQPFSADTPADDSKPEISRTIPRPAKLAAKDAEGYLKWPEGLKAGKQRAAADQRPLLVKAGFEGCVWCAKLELEFQKPEVQRELARWTLTYLDADKGLDEANRLKVSGFPALRILDLHGQLVAQQDGYLPAEKLLDWLRENHPAATAMADSVLVSDSPLDEAVVAELIGHLQNRNPLQREAAIRRLTAEPAIAKKAVVDSLRTGNLSTRLAALEVLQQWQAPVSDLDPWQPQTFNSEREADLEHWLTKDIQSKHEAPEELTPEEQERARAEMKEMLAASEAEVVRTRRERLVRFGRALLPLVRDASAQATTDEARERLLALRYRLAADDTLILNWPGGLERLASRDVHERHLAAEELATRAGARDGNLLLELFSDPDPLVREISLRGLQHAGGAETMQRMVELLNDPDPNVRAAVLKQLAEGESSGLASHVVEYVQQEKDPDLLVHAIRYLKSTKTDDAKACLLDLTAHDSWQVRAEAAEALGATIGQEDFDQLSTFNRLIELLDDDDSFVVSRSMEAIARGKIPARVVDKLAVAAEKHPELAVATVKVLAKSQLTSQAIPHLAKFITHAQPQVRAAAIDALASLSPDDYSEELLKSLSDPEPTVRTAGASAIFQVSHNLRQAARESGFGLSGTVRPELPDSNPPGFFESVLSLFGGTRGQPAEKPVRKPPAPVPEAENEDAPAEPQDKPKENVAEDLDPQAGDEDEAAAREAPADQNPEEAWIQRYRQGKKRPAWINETIEPLTNMMSAENSQERFAAALALIPLTDDPRTIAVLKEVAAEDREKLSEASKALSWLVWEQRLDLFDFLMSKKPDHGEMHVIGQAMAELRDPRSAEPLWKLLGEDDVDLQLGVSLRYVLEQIYRGNTHDPFNNAQIKNIEPALRKYAEQGPPAQRVLALDLMRSLIPEGDVTAELAAEMLADPQLPDDLRLEVFRILLFTQNESAATASAIQILVDKNAQLLGVAVRFLAKGVMGIGQIENSPLPMFDARRYQDPFGANGEEALVEAPEGLTLEMVQPLLEDPDRETAACASYLLATLGDGSGMEPLLSHWRNQANNVENRKLVVRAIAMLDDPQYIPVLEEIYGKLESHEAREFYWTIRAMTGPEVLALRKKIRSEVGMDRLR